MKRVYVVRDRASGMWAVERSWSDDRTLFSDQRAALAFAARIAQANRCGVHRIDSDGDGMSTVKLDAAVSLAERLGREDASFSGDVVKSVGGYELLEGAGRDGGTWLVHSKRGKTEKFTSRAAAEKFLKSVAE